MSVSVALSGASAITEASGYSLGYSAGGDAAGSLTNWSIDWGDGAADTTASAAGSTSHAYDGVALPYTVTATARGQRVNPGSDGNGFVTDSAVQADGKIVTVGGTGSDIEVRRYLATGSPDTSFGGTGRVVVAVSGASSSHGASVAIDSTGRVVVAGTATVAGHDELALARLGAGGSVDFTTHTLIGTAASGAGVVVLPGDAIVVGGSATVSGSTDFALAGYTASGALDTSFGTAGVTTTAFAGFDTIADLSVHTNSLGAPDGIVAAGSQDQGVTNVQTVVAKYTLTGTLTASVVDDVSPSRETPADVVFAGGKILVGGVINTGEGLLSLVRYNDSLTRDTSFAAGGALTTALFPSSPTDQFSPTVQNVAVAADGSIYVGTTVQNADLSGPDAGKAGFALLRVRSAGAVDSGFGNNGLSFTLDPSTGLSGGSAVLLPGGGIAQSGTVQDVGFGGTDGATVFYGTASQSVAVANVVPSAGLVGSSTGVAHEEQSFILSVNDVSAADRAAGLTVVLDYGDGSPTESGLIQEDPNFPWGGAGFVFPASHIYTDASTYTATLTVTDKDGGVTVGSKTVLIPTISVIADPENGGTMAVVSGNRTGGANGGNNNVIDVGAATGGTRITVDNVNTTVTGVGRVVAYGNDGNDTITVTGNVSVPVEFYGGNGVDYLRGGNQADILSGGDGTDLLVGGSGRDVLIGGLGLDRIVGDADDDVLIGGYLSGEDTWDQFGVDRFSLAEIRNEWTSNHTYTQRVQNLRDGSGTPGFELNPDVHLVANDTVLDDNIIDVLTGNGGQDWFFANVDAGNRDLITDLSSREFVDDLDFINAAV